MNKQQVLVEWDERASLYLTPAELHSGKPREGELRADDQGSVWYHDGHGNMIVLGRLVDKKHKPMPPPKDFDLSADEVDFDSALGKGPDRETKK